jgi:hypothetical protein
MEWFPVYMWNIVLGPVFAISGFLIFGFLWREFGERTPRLLLFVGLAGYAVSIALDAADGADFFPAEAVDHARVVEECLEMLSTTIIWLAFLTHITSLAGTGSSPPRVEIESQARRGIG